MMFGRTLSVSAGLLVLAGAASAQLIVDYDNQLGGTAAPVVGSGYWHGAVNSTTSGQSRNVGLWSNPTVATSTATNISRVTASAPAGLVQGNAYELRWSFMGTGTGTNRSANEADTFLRVAGAGTAMLNPVIDTSKTLLFDVWTSQPLRVSLIFSDAAQTAAVGSPGVAPQLEALGGTGTDKLETTGQGYGGYTLTGGQWQTVEVDFTQLTLRNLNGNNVFSPATPDRIALNGLGFTPLAGEGGLQLQHEVYLDNFRLSGVPVPEPGTMLALGAGVAAIAARRRRRKS